MSATARHLDLLFGCCERGVVEFRAIPSGRRTFTAIGNWSGAGSFVTQEVRARQSVLVGAATRRDSSGGDEQNLSELSTLFVDLDAPPDVTRTRLRDFPFRWSLFVASGYGSHVYWKLREPLDVSNADERTRTASLLRRLSSYLGGDPRATSPATAPRLVGTRNWKYAEPRPVALVEETDHVVNPSELEDFLPAETSRRGQHTLAATFPIGTRNDSIYLVIRSLHAHKVPFKEIAKRVHEINQTQCEEPLPDAEICQLLKYAGQRQLDRPGFRGLLPPSVIVHDASPRKDRSS